MSYTPSTKAAGFKNRSVPDMSKDIAALAKAKDKQRASDVANFQQQANGQLTELARQDSVMTQNDAYELANLKQFSNTLNDFLDTSAKTLGKAYIDVKRREGTELARKYRAGDEEAIAKIDGTQAQLDEVEKKLAEQKNDTRSAGGQNQNLFSFSGIKPQKEYNLKITISKGLVAVEPEIQPKPASSPAEFKVTWQYDDKYGPTEELKLKSLSRLRMMRNRQTREASSIGKAPGTSAETAIDVGLSRESNFKQPCVSRSEV